MPQTKSSHLLLTVVFAFVALAVAEAGDTAVAGANTPTTQVHRRITTAEWMEWRAIRNWYGTIPDLDRKYEERRHSNGLPYHLHVPAGLEPETKYPLVIYLHGHTDLALDVRHGFPKGVWSLQSVQEKHPHIVFIPRHQNVDQRWEDEPYLSMTIQAIDDLIAEFERHPSGPQIDPDRLYLTGFSKGGTGTWAFLGKHPEKFAAAVPVAASGGGPQTVAAASRISHIPLWFFSGEDDYKAAPRAIQYFDLLRQAHGRDVTYHELIGLRHVIDDFVYFTPGFMDWLFAQRRNAH